MTFVCGHCGAQLAIDGGLRTVTCAFCASPSVIEHPDGEGGPRPVFTIGFVQPEPEVRAHVARWLRSRSIFCPGSIRNARVEDLQAAYVPAYLYSAVASTRFRARIGENYTVTETETETDSQGRTVKRTRTRVETEWRPLTGTRLANVSDVVVSASHGLSNAELEGVEPFDWRALRRYSPALVAGWLTENAAVPASTCLEAARAKATTRAGRALASFMPGDSHRDLEHTTQLEDEASDLVLVPLWLLNARHRKDAPPIRIVVNGQTGAVHGRPPLSPLRITLAVFSLLAALAGLMWALR
jgi:hypothetical protein